MVSCDLRRSDCGSEVLDVGVESCSFSKKVDRRVLTADFDEALGLMTCEGGSVQPYRPNSVTSRGSAQV